MPRSMMQGFPFFPCYKDGYSTKKWSDPPETLEEIKARLTPKKTSIPLAMLDSANSYDDKVAVLRMLAADDPGRVANSIKRLIEV